MSRGLPGMQLRGIDTNLIVALHALLGHRNVTRAGKELGLSQSSMSHTLARLRAHFDDPLLVKVGRELSLTPRAKSLVEPAALAVAQMERVFARGETFDPAVSKRIFRIAATDNLELYVLPKLAAVLHEEAPGVDVRVSALPEDWMVNLQRGDIDLKLGRKYPRLPDTLESEDLSLEEFDCVVRRRHRAREKLTIESYAALDHLLVVPSASPRATPSGVVDKLLAKHGLERRIAMTVPHFLVAPFVVAHSELALTAPKRLLAPFLDSLELRSLTLPLEIPRYSLSQVWSSRTRDDQGNRWLRERVASIFAED